MKEVQKPKKVKGVINTKYYTFSLNKVTDKRLVSFLRKHKSLSAFIRQLLYKELDKDN